MGAAIDHALNEAMLTALETPPALVRTIYSHDFSREASQWLDAVEERAATGERRLEMVRERIDRDRAALSDAFATSRASERQLASLKRLAVAIEEHASREIERTISVVRSARKTNKKFGQMFPEYRARMNSISERLERNIEDELNEHLEFALFLRALHTKYSPAEPGPTFNTSVDLTKYLQSLVA